MRSWRPFRNQRIHAQRSIKWGTNSVKKLLFCPGMSAILKRCTISLCSKPVNEGEGEGQDPVTAVCEWPQKKESQIDRIWADVVVVIVSLSDE